MDDIVNIGIGLPEMVTRHARKNGMLDNITLTVESGSIGGFQWGAGYLLYGCL